MNKDDNAYSKMGAETLRMELGKYIQKHRKQKGYSQQGLAELLGVTAKSISCNERGDTFPSYENIFHMARVLDMSLDEFVFGCCCYKNAFSFSEINDLLSSLDMEDRRTIIETVKTMSEQMSKRSQK